MKYMYKSNEGKEESGKNLIHGTWKFAQSPSGFPHVFLESR